MAFLRSIRPDEDLEVIRGQTLTLRQPAIVGDYAEWAELRALEPRASDAMGADVGAMTISRAPCTAAGCGPTRRMFATTSSTLISSSTVATDTLLGGITLSNVRRGSAQTASLGYWMGAPYAGRGHMRDAVENVAAGRVQRAAPAPYRSGDDAEQHRIHSRARIRPASRGRAGARLSQDQWALGRSPALRASSRIAPVSRHRGKAEGPDAKLGEQQRATRRGPGSPRLGVARLRRFAPVAGRAEALTPIPVQADQDRIEITTLGEAYEGRGDSLQVETAAGADGVSGRMTVRASVPGTSPNWMVFALTNKTDKSLERC